MTALSGVVHPAEMVLETQDGEDEPTDEHGQGEIGRSAGDDGDEDAGERGATPHEQREAKDRGGRTPAVGLLHLGARRPALQQQHLAVGTAHRHGAENQHQHGRREEAEPR